MRVSAIFCLAGAVCLGGCSLNDAAEGVLNVLPEISIANEGAFARGCSATDSEPQEVVRFCGLALKSGELSSGDQARALVNRGRALERLGQTRRAMGDYQEAARIDPSVRQAWTGLGWTQQRQKLHQPALMSFERALALDPSATRALVGRGAALTALGAPDRAIANFNAALQVEPDMRDALFYRAAASLALEDRLSASADLGRVLEADAADLEALLLRAQLRETDFTRGALGDYAAAIAAAPEDPRGYYRRGRLLISLQDEAAAAPDLRRAWELGFRDVWLHGWITKRGR